MPLSASSNFPGLRSRRAGKRALFVSEQFAFEQIFRDRRAVDLDERAGGALRVLVNGAGDQVFSDAAFAAEQHRRVRRRDALDQREHRLHFVALRDDVGVGVAAAQLFAQRAVFLAQAARIELLADLQDEFGERKGLRHKVARADLHRLDGRFDRAVSGHHDHGQRRVRALHGLQKFQAAHSRQAQVRHDEIGFFADQKLQARFCVRRRVNDETFLAELQFEQPPHFGFVFDDEDRRFFCACGHGFKWHRLQSVGFRSWIQNLPSWQDQLETHRLKSVLLESCYWVPIVPAREYGSEAAIYN